MDAGVKQGSRPRNTAGRKDLPTWWVSVVSGIFGADEKGQCVALINFLKFRGECHPGLLPSSSVTPAKSQLF